MVVTAATAQERTVGVAEGDWFSYEIIVSWESTSPDELPPPSYGDWERMNGTEWAKITITDVSGTNVSFQYLTHYKNGTEETGNGYIDVDTGDSAQGAFTIIAANLDVNDSVYTSGDYSTYTINETRTRAYQDGVRNTNHLNMSHELSWTIGETDYSFCQTSNFYWDKETGVLAEDIIDFHNQTGEHQTTLSIATRVTDSNVWVVPEFPVGSSMLVIAVIVTVTIISIEHRLTKKQPTDNN
jgi:hypothetical protein